MSVLVTVVCFVVVAAVQFAWWRSRQRGKPYDVVICGLRATIRPDGNVYLHETPTREELDLLEAWLEANELPHPATWRVLERPFR